MAKVYYPATVGGIIGTVNTGVYYRSGSTKFGYLRSWVYPKRSTSNEVRGSWINNLSKIWATGSAEYKADLQSYAAQYKNLPVYGDPYKHRTSSTFAIWYKAVVAWAEDNPSIDLGTLSAEDLSLVATDINTVKNCIDNGYLPIVDDYSSLTEGF